MKKLLKKLEISGIYLYITNIHDFISSHILQADPETYTREKSILFSSGTFMPEIFSADELDVVNSFKTLKKQVERLCGWYSVKQLYLKHHPQAPAPLDIKIDYETHGAPFLVIAPESCITISHSGKYAVGGFSSCVGRKIALDLERMENKDMTHILSVAFSDKETELVENRSYIGVYKNWTIKEAYLKYIRKGFHESLKKVEVINDLIIHDGKKMNQLHIHTEILFNTYRLSVVYD